MVVYVLLYLTVALWSPAILCSYLYKFVSAVGLTISVIELLFFFIGEPKVHVLLLELSLS